MTQGRRKGSVLDFCSKKCGGLSSSIGGGERSCSPGRMGAVVLVLVVVKAFVGCRALLDLSGAAQVKGVWMGSATIPCTYMPSRGFTQQVLIWRVERDLSTSTIFRRDASGDHILLSRFRNRVSVPKSSPGDASLHITDLEIPDSGHYTCQVSWRSENYSLITKEVTTTVKVSKVAVTKPTIVAGELGLAVPVGAKASLTCVAQGSPPINYHWFRMAPGRSGQLLGNEAELVWSSLQPSDAGVYYCEVKNRVNTQMVQRSDAVELTVRDLPEAAVTSENVVGYPETDETTQSSWRTHLYLVIPIAVLGGAVVFLVIFAIACARKPKNESIYEVAFHRTADVIRLDTDVEVPVKCRKEKINSETEESYENVTVTCNNYESITGNSYENTCLSKDAESETLVNAMESEYEVQNFQ
ncbi:V-set and immunoglobulin domain-containing protein 4 isoform X2 [Lagopus leucura]|uniref:V-set and immunoglobulin domain-containing protein 4 isoform X2 n=1 Tax=Lagopus leucura TaxID=30410 RepID=UPI001C66E589|nr:V-set and immunoglobulin domain-containing protein 4 isoform X2 [Lagopus leucura]